MPQPLLFTPIKLAGLTARNRIVVSPMCQYSSDEGGPSDWHLVHLGKFALGGAAVVFCEETAVEMRARKTYGCAGIYSDAHVPMYRRITGFNQFLSPLANQRTDAYGGDLSGRMRFALELTEAVRAVWPQDKPLWFRVSAVDGDNGAWAIDDTVALVRELKSRGVNAVSCSSGGINGPLNYAIVPRQPGFQVPYAERVRRDTGITTCAVGLITEPEHAEDILQRGQADLIAMAREFMYNPNWPVHAARTLGVSDYLDLLPTEYAWWLKRREKIREISK